MNNIWEKEKKKLKMFEDGNDMYEGIFKRIYINLEKLG